MAYSGTWDQSQTTTGPQIRNSRGLMSRGSAPRFTV